MLHNATVVCFAGIDWSFNWQVTQEVATGLANAGNRVLFIENTGVRAPRWKDARRLWSRVRNRLRSPRGMHAERRSHVDVYSPVLIPAPYSRLAVASNRAVLLRALNAWIGKRDRPLVVLTFLPTPLIRSVIARLHPDLVVYYAVDRLSESSPGAAPLRPHEEAMLEEADLVLTTSEPLYAVAARIARRVERLPGGVRYEEFQRARELSTEAPPAGFEAVTGPVVGFVGSLREELDLELLRETARHTPDLTFILVGPILADVRSLAALPNVRLIGPVTHSEAMRYMVRFDVGILPYVRNEYTRFIMPMKLKEYLAAGLPVVATPLIEMQRFADEHPDATFSFVETADEFASALRAAVAVDQRHLAEARTRVARLYDWQVQMAMLGSWLNDALAHAAAGAPRPR